MTERRIQAQMEPQSELFVITMALPPLHVPSRLQRQPTALALPASLSSFWSYGPFARRTQEVSPETVNRVALPTARHPSLIKASASPFSSPYYIVEK